MADSSRELLMICLATLFVLLAWLLAVYALVKLPRQRRFSPKVLAILAGNLFLLAVSAYLAWPLTPWGQAQALRTANRFMEYLHTENPQAAFEMIAGSMSDEERTKIRNGLENPANFPQSWELKITAFVYLASGQATFRDGDRLSVQIFLDWMWESASWKINGVRCQVWGDPAPDNIMFTHASISSYSSIKMLWIPLNILCGILGASSLLAELQRSRRFQFTP